MKKFLSSLLASSLLCAIVSCASFKSPSVRMVSESPILAGPMVGHVEEHSAVVWLRTGEGATITAESVQGGKVVSRSPRAESVGGGFEILHFESLRANTPTEARLSVKNRNGTAEEKVSFRTAPPAEKTGKLRVAFGSCAKASEYPALPIFKAIADENPDLMIFCGDNSYFIVGGEGEKRNGTSGPAGDWTSPEKMLARHLEMRTHPDLQPLLRSIPCYAVWDDHDYGPNNSDRTFDLKEDSLRLFKQVWANPSYGTAGTPGIFSSFRRGPVEIFLMDDRYYKYVRTEEHPNVAPAEAEIWGAAQLQWLEAGLKASTAPVKLIVNGTQVLSETKDGEGHFQEAPMERERLFAFLRENKIGGVAFLTGDRHYTECLRLAQPGGPDIMEFTSSPLEQGREVGPLETNKNRTRVWGMNGNSYGLVTVDIPEEGKGTIRFEARDKTRLRSRKLRIK
ncbi:alkaline phosphatase family protein [Candidatus Sumerlaeota bacterium]|nr:alkaline phosphatase family protein [Candidatus Sumerlaeota bacterium]